MAAQVYPVSGEVHFRRNLLIALTAFAAGAAAIQLSQINTPTFHTILDTSVILTGALVALLLYDIAWRSGQTLALLLSASFGVLAVGEAIHTAAALEWLSGGRFGIAEVQWRAGTWGPAAHILAIGTAAAYLFRDRPHRFAWPFTMGLLLLGAALLVLFQLLPRYSPPGFLGITRPTLLAVPLLWTALAYGYRRLGRDSQIARAVAGTAVLMTLAHGIMLFSQAPNDPDAMVAHYGKIVADMLLLLTLTQMGAADTARRLRAEQALTEANHRLEERVRQRTAALLETNAGLKQQIALREEAEAKLRIQLARLDLLNRITRAIGQRQDPRSIFQIVASNLEEQLPADFVAILAYDGTALRVQHVGGRSAALAQRMEMSEGVEIPIDQNGLSRCVAGQLIYEPCLPGVEFPFPARLARSGLGALVMSPLMLGAEISGVLLVARVQPHAFSSTDCEFQRQLSEQIALAASHVMLVSSLQKAYDDLRQSQAAAVQQERLLALGQMASGIAHDINNAVSPLALHTATLLEREPGLSPALRGYLEMARRVTDDVAATVGRLREFYRDREPQSAMVAVNLNQMVQQTIDLTRARWSDMPQQRGITVKVRTDLDPRLPAVQGHAGELRELLTNLIFNAVDALPRGGDILVLTARRDGRVLLEVRDNGAGMDADTLRRCMEPFFTTKGERGTGLGLAMVFGSAKRHGAEIEIDSAPGRGTAMRLIFPESAASQPAAPAPDTGVMPDPMRLLLIDDDPFVLDSLRVVLELDGHTVTEAGGGAQGVEAMRATLAQGENFDAVITDLGMPDMDGSKVAQAIKTMSPATPVILLTGWGQRLRGEDSESGHVDKVLSKPPQLEELREALAAVAP